MVFKRKENSGQLERPSLPVLSMFQKSGRTHQLRLVIFPRYFFKFLYIPTVVGLEISEPSTVSSKTLVGRVSWTTFVSGWVSKSKSDTHLKFLREFSPEGHQKNPKGSTGSSPKRFTFFRGLLLLNFLGVVDSNGSNFSYKNLSLRRDTSNIVVIYKPAHLRNQFLGRSYFKEWFINLKEVLHKDRAVFWEVCPQPVVKTC